jgi:predicted extracellular nuclease
MKLRVATFNIRNSSAPDGDNAWPVRRNATVAAIEHLDADVVGLVGVVPDQLE